MSATLHPPAELLLSYAAGSLDEASALLIATHATLCPLCRDEIAANEALGGLVLDELPPDRMRDDALSSLLQRLTDEPAPAAAPKEAMPKLPAPLLPYVKSKDRQIHWHFVAPGIKQTPLLERPEVRVRLLKISAGKPMPHHRHGGTEYTLVLEGAYRDETGHFGVGDFIIADLEVGHQPVAAEKGCVCLVMSVAPVQLTSRLGRLFNPFMPF